MHGVTSCRDIHRETLNYKILKFVELRKSMSLLSEALQTEIIKNVFSYHVKKLQFSYQYQNKKATEQP